MKKNYQQKELTEILSKFSNNEITMDDLLKKIKLKEKPIKTPYFRYTKSKAIACYGVKREPIVLYRGQWMKLAKVFVGGKDCEFNKFFYRNRFNKKVEKKDTLKIEDKMNKIK